MRTILGDMGPRDQRAVELQLFVSSLVPDTDFMGKLVDVYPDGRAIILTEGILRARIHGTL